MTATDLPGTSMSRLKTSLLQHLGVIGGMMVLACLLTWPVAPRLLTHKTAHADAEIFRWNLWWAHKVMNGPGQTFFYTDDLFYPTGVSLEMAPLSLLNSVPAAPLVGWLGVPAAFNILLLAGYVLSGYFMFLLARHVTKDPVLSLWPAFVFAFLPFHRAHVYQLDYFSIQWIPLVALCLLRLFEKPTPLRGLALGLSVAACGLACEAYGAMLVVFVVVFLAWGLAVARRRILDRRFLLCACLAALAAFFSFLPRAGPVLFSRDVGMVRMETADLWSADPIAYVTPALDHRLIGPYMMKVYQYFPGLYHNWTVFLGLATVALCAAAWLLRGPRPSTLWLWTAAVFFILSLGPVLHIVGKSTFAIAGRSFSVPLPFAALHAIPPFSTLRVPSLFSIFTACAVCVMATTGCRKVLDLLQRRRPLQDPAATKRRVVVLLVLLSYAEFMPSNFATYRVVVPESFRAIRRDPRRFAVLDVPSSAAEAMYFQTMHEKPIFGGWVERKPDSVGRPFSSAPMLAAMFSWNGKQDLPWNTFDATESAREFAAHDVGYVILHKKGLPPSWIANARRWFETAGLFDTVGDEADLVVFKRRS